MCGRLIVLKLESELTDFRAEARAEALSSLELEPHQAVSVEDIIASKQAEVEETIEKTTKISLNRDKILTLRDDAEMRLERCQNEVSDYKEENEVLQEEIRTLREAVGGLDDKALLALKDENAALQLALDKENKRYRVLESFADKWRGQLDDAEQRLAATIPEIIHREKRLLMLVEELDSLKEWMKSQAAEGVADGDSSTQDLIAKMSDTIQQKQHEIELMVSLCSGLDGRTAQLEKAIERGETKLMTMVEDANVKQEQFSDLQEEYANLQQMLGLDKCEIMEALNKEFQKCKSNLKISRANVDQAVKRANRLKDQKVDYELRLVEAFDTIQKGKEELRVTFEDRDKWKEMAMMDQDACVEELINQVNENKLSKKALDLEIGLLQAETEKLRAERDTAEADLVLKVATFDKKLKQSVETCKRIRAERDQLQAMMGGGDVVEQLMKALEEKGARLEVWNAKVIKLEEEVLLARRLRDDAEKDRQKLIDEVNQQKENVEAAKDQTEVYKKMMGIDENERLKVACEELEKVTKLAQEAKLAQKRSEEHAEKLRLLRNAAETSAQRNAQETANLREANADLAKEVADQLSMNQDDRVATLKDKVKELKEEVSQLKRDAEAAEAHAEEALKQMNGAEHRQLSCKFELEVLVTKIAQLNAQMELERGASNADSRTIKAQLVAQIQSQVEEIDNIKGRIVHLQTLSKIANTAREDAEARLIAGVLELEANGTKMDELKAEVARLTGLLAGDSDGMSNLMEDQESKKRQIGDLKLALDNSNKKAEKALGTRDKLEAQLRLKAETLSVAEVRLAELEGDIPIQIKKALDDALNDWQKEAEQAREAHGEAIKLRAASQAELAKKAYTEHSESLHASELDSIKSGHKTAMDEIGKVVEHQAASMASLEQKFSDVQAKFDELSADYSRIEESLSLARRMAKTNKGGDNEMEMKLRNDNLVLTNECTLLNNQLVTLSQVVKVGEPTKSTREWQLERLLESTNETVTILEAKIQTQQRQFVSMSFDRR